MKIALAVIGFVILALFVIGLSSGPSRTRDTSLASGPIRAGDTARDRCIRKNAVALSGARDDYLSAAATICDATHDLTGEYGE